MLHTERVITEQIAETSVDFRTGLMWQSVLCNADTVRYHRETD